MILTCPRCATRYFVADGQITPGGREVRCAECQERWTAWPTMGPADVVEPAPVQARAPAVSPLFAAARPKSPLPLKLIGSFRTAGVAAALILLMVLAFVFRTEIARLWPG